MAKRENSGPTMFTDVDDDLYDELAALTEQRIVHVEIWEDSLTDALADQEVDPADQIFFDLDLYLEEGVYFELYGVSGFTGLDEAPVRGAEAIGRHLLSLVNQGTLLSEIAVDDEENLVLVLGQPQAPQLYLIVGGWLVEEWEELPAT